MKYRSTKFSSFRGMSLQPAPACARLRWRRLGCALLLAVVAAGAQSRPWAQWGRIWASAFDAWTLRSMTSVTAPGTYTLQIQTENPPVIAGGPTIQPLSSNAPLLIDIGAAQEVATPMAVHCSWSPGTCTATIMLAKAHRAPFSLRSGTAGLQEAINYAIFAGGGMVVIDPSWTGTFAMIGHAGDARVSVRDERAGQMQAYTWNGSSYAAAGGLAFAGQVPGPDPAAQVRNAYSLLPSTIAVAGTVGSGEPTQSWQANSNYSVGQYVADANGGLEQCTTAGISGTSQPTWSVTVGGTAVDGTVVWTLQEGNVSNTALFDLRGGTPAAPTSGRLFPYANIFLPIWDDSAAQPFNSAPFEPLNNASPITFSTIIHETGSADPSGLFIDEEMSSPGAGGEGNPGAIVANCTLNPGDTHGGCWGVNEGVGSWSTAQTLQGNEVNLFDNAADANNHNGGYNAGPYWGFEATSSGSNSPLAAYFVNASSSANRWYDGLFVPNAVWAGVECGHPGVMDLSPMLGGCVVSNATGVATASANFASYPITFSANAWNGAANAPYDASESFKPLAGVNPVIGLEWDLSGPSVPTEILAANLDYLGNFKSANSLTAGISLANSITASGSSAGDPVLLSAAGTDANITIALMPKGTGEIAAMGAVNLLGGATLPSGQTLVNAGAIAGTGIFNFVGGTLEQPAVFTVNGITVVNPTIAGALALSGACPENQFMAAASNSAAPECAQPSAANLSNGTVGAGAVVLASSLPLSGSVAGSINTLAANSCGDAVTVAIAGAGVGMVAVASSAAAFPAAGGNVTVAAAVTASGIVTVGYCNLSGTPVTPVGATIQVRVLP